MTNCEGTFSDQFLLDYLMGELAEGQAEEFEDHYFECPSCLARVEALQAVQNKLRTEPRQAYRAPIPWPVRFAAIGAIAAMLIAVAFLFHGRQTARPPSVAAVPEVNLPRQGTDTSKSQSSTLISKLADFELPAFAMPQLRGQQSNAEFYAGMKSYAQQDFPAAIKTLAQVPVKDPDAIAARFYSGVCLMHVGDFAGAFEKLRSVAEAGDSPQQEAAYYYLAQSAIAEGDISDARHELALTIALRGDFEHRARHQLAQLSQVAGSR